MLGGFRSHTSSSLISKRFELMTLIQTDKVVNGNIRQGFSPTLLNISRYLECWKRSTVLLSPKGSCMSSHPARPDAGPCMCSRRRATAKGPAAGAGGVQDGERARAQQAPSSSLRATAPHRGAMPLVGVCNGHDNFLAVGSKVS